MTGTRLKFALVGCGYIGKRYVTILSQHPQCELTALIDPDSNRLASCKQLNIPVFNSTEAYFHSNIESDAAVIATPNGTHASIAMAFLKRKKHVLIEKPMALKRSDAETVIQTANEQSKKLMVVLQNRFSPVSIWLKEIVESKRLGRVFFVEVNCFWNRDERYYKKDGWHGTKEMDGGSLFTQFSHFIDMVYWLFGNIKNISSRFNNFNHQQLIQFEDTGSVHFEFEEGGMGCINFSTAVWDKSLESSLTIIAENGSIKISGQYMNKIEHCHIKNYSLPVALDDVHSSAGNHYKMINTFVDAILKNSSTNAEEALCSVDILERMYSTYLEDKNEPRRTQPLNN